MGKPRALAAIPWGNCPKPANVIPRAKKLLTLLHFSPASKPLPMLLDHMHRTARTLRGLGWVTCDSCSIWARELPRASSQLSPLCFSFVFVLISFFFFLASKGKLCVVECVYCYYFILWALHCGCKTCEFRLMSWYGRVRPLLVSQNCGLPLCMLLNIYGLSSGIR